ncbi:glycosyltransferase family 2 protein [Salinibacter ruber]|uniref:glycosyltransferase family 2 protein n=1 Tax=Salinibacter ruber TaxID=146919 RepID=UPI000E57712D|nr:glycosyltransferase family 2 protein [Salinibacter ruber]
MSKKYRKRKNSPGYVKSEIVSVVVPCYNEEKVIETTHKRLSDVMEEETVDFEIIYVDDGSHDQTLNLLYDLHDRDDRVQVISLSRNYGHQVAITAGTDYARGDAVVVIDADLQDPPEVIPRMIEKWREGVDVVYGKRKQREGEGAFKRWSAKIFYRFINRISSVEIPLDTGDFRLMDRRAVEAFLEMPERDRFVRGMVSWLGFEQEPVEYERAPRHAGETKYPLSEMVEFATDGILSFSTAPLKIATWAGFLASGLSMLGIIYALALRLFTSIWVPGWTALFISILFLGGLQLISLGIIGEYVGRIYGETKRRPLYLIQEHREAEDDPSAEEPKNAGMRG